MVSRSDDSHSSAKALAPPAPSSARSLAPAAPSSAIGLAPPPPAQDEAWYQKVGDALSVAGHHTAEAFGKISDLASRIEEPWARAGGRLLDAVLPKALGAGGYAAAAQTGVAAEPAAQLAQKAIPTTPEQEEAHPIAAAVGDVAGSVAQLPLTGPAGFVPAQMAETGIDHYDRGRKAGLSVADSMKEATGHALLTGATMYGGGKLSEVAAAKIVGPVMAKLEVASGGALTAAARKALTGATTGGSFAAAGEASNVVGRVLDQYADPKDLQKLAGTSRGGREALVNAATGFITSILGPHPAAAERAAGATSENPPGAPPVADPGLAEKGGLEAQALRQEPSQDALAKYGAEAKAKFPHLSERDAAFALAMSEATSLPPPVGGVAQAEPIHPAQAQIDEQMANQTRIRELDERSKKLRQNGKGGQSLPLDQERVALLKRQQDLTLEIALRNAQAAHGGTEPATQDPDGQRAFRLSDPRMQEDLRAMAREVGVAQEGGQPVITDPREGTYSERLALKGRTRAVNNAEWWDERPSGDTHGANGGDLRDLVEKVSSNPSVRLGSMQKEMLDFMMDRIDRERGPTEGGFPWEDKAAQQAALSDALTSEKQGQGLPARDARLEAEKWVNGNLSEAKEAGLTPDFTKPPEPPGDLPPTPPIGGNAGSPPPEEVPISKTSAFQTFMTGLRGNKAVNALRAKMDQLRLHAELRATLNLTPAEKLVEEMQPPGQGKYAALGDAITLHLNMLKADGTSRLEEQLSKFGDGLSDEKMKIVGDTGRLTPQQIDIANRLIKANATWGKTLQDMGLLRNARDIYSGLKWKEGPAGEGPERPSRAAFSTFSVHVLPRTYESILEGWANGRELAIRNPIDAQYEVRRSTFEAAENARWIKEGRALRYFSPFAAEGRTEIDHPGFRDWADAGSIKLGADHAEMAKALSEKLGEPVPEEEALKIYGWSRDQGEKSTDQLGVYGRDLRIMSDGQNIRIMERKKLFAPNDVATLINREFGKRPLSSDGVFRGINAVQKAVRRSLFALATFHQIATTQHFLLGKPLGDADVGTPLSYRDGYEQLMAHGDNIEYLVRNGNLRPLPQAEYEQLLDREHTAIGKKLDEIPGIGGAKNLIQNQLARIKQFALGTVVPGFQVQGALLDQAILRAKGQYSEAEIARAVGRVWNNAVGVSNPDIVRKPLWSDIRSMGLNAPQWTGGAYRRFVDMAQAGATGELQRAFMGRAVTKFVVAHVAWHMAMASIQNPQHPIDEYWELMKKKWSGGLADLLGFDVSALAQKLGRTDPRRFYIGASGNLFEPAGAGLVAGGVQMLRAHGKTGPIAAGGSEMQATMGVAARIAAEMLSGTNWRGESYTTTPEFHGYDDKGTYRTNRMGKYFAGMEKGGQLTGQLTSYRSGAKPPFLGASQYETWLLSQAKENAPIPAQSVMRAMQGSIDAVPALLGAVGFHFGYGPKDENAPVKAKR